MPFYIVHNDITKMKTEAIVNAANTHLAMGAGVCGAIFKGAGCEKLEKACNKIGGCPVGHAVITEGFNLSAKYIIHTVGPVWRGGTNNEEEDLRSAYKSSLDLAKSSNIKSISFPLISSGIYGYPKRQALRVAEEAIKEFLTSNEMDVYMVVYDRETVLLGEELHSDLEHYIDEFFIPESFYGRVEKCTCYEPLECESQMVSLNHDLKSELDSLDKTFSQYLLELIDRKGMEDTEVYKRSNIDRKLFSKIRSNKDYKPKKSTILSLAIGMKLNIKETEDLLLKAGYSLSSSIKFDVIVKYFITNRKYDIYEVNNALFSFNEKMLGA